MLGLIFYLSCKLDSFFDCLDIYYQFLWIPFDVPTLIKDIRKLFYTLYDKYAKYYRPFLNINFEQNIPSAQILTS